jgi:predicted dehydrogenase
MAIHTNNEPRISQLESTFMITKKRFAAVGTGSRISMFIDPIAGCYSDNNELVALCDISQARMDYHVNRLQKDYGYGKIKTYLAQDFERMLMETRPDAVIICTVDAMHHEYILRSVAAGCDVVCEKPITVDDEKCRALLAALGETDCKMRLTFNVRWQPGPTLIRQLISEGKIGRVRHVQLEYLLNTVHGASYFQRWHSSKTNSGGLLVHKSTHHFDLVNWLIDAIPQRVFAFGDLVFYGKENAVARGDEAWTKYDRYTGKADSNDPFRVDLTQNDILRSLYLDAEKDNGYVRDRNVFREGIDIEDRMSVLVKYRDGATLSYHLNSFSPWEGYRMAIVGDAGRIEYEETYQSPQMEGEATEEVKLDPVAAGAQVCNVTWLPLFGKGKVLSVPIIEDGHGGGDSPLQEQIFAANPPADPFGRSASYQQGVASAIIGIAANHSIKSGLPVEIDSLVTLKPEALKLSELK